FPSTSACALSRRRSRATNCPTSTGAIWSGSRAGSTPRTSRRPERRSVVPAAQAAAGVVQCRLRQQRAVADAPHVRHDADLAGEALQRVPVGAVVHQGEVEAELERYACAVSLRFEGGLE